MTLYSIRRYTGTGSPQVLEVPPYLDKSHISVWVGTTLTMGYTWVTGSTISITAAPGAAIVIQRKTSPDARLVNYLSGVTLTEETLDQDSLQAFYLAQEAQDVYTELVSLSEAPLDTAIGAAVAANTSAAAAAASAAEAAAVAESIGANVIEFGADPTGVALSNAAFDAAKAQCKTLRLPPGTYRLEGWTAQDVRLIGVRATGANFGANEQVVIEGSGDLLVGANNFGMEHLVIRNSAAGVRGKLITCADMDTMIGPFIDVDFRKATHHVYQNFQSKTLVSVAYRNCRFTDATVYSRYYAGSLFGYLEDERCYTQANQRGLYLGNGCSAVKLSGVMEFQKEGAIYVMTPGFATSFNLKLDTLHFENNGTVTPSPDITLRTVEIGGALQHVHLDNVTFNASTIPAGNVDGLNSANLRVLLTNCRGHALANIAATAKVNEPALATLTSAGLTVPGRVNAVSGFSSGAANSVTISGAATNLMAVPPTFEGRMVLVYDFTTPGLALLLVHNTGVAVGLNTTASITFSVSGGFLKAQTSGGATNRVLYMTALST